jgi:hypothetical protein
VYLKIATARWLDIGIRNLAEMSEFGTLEAYRGGLTMSACGGEDRKGASEGHTDAIDP